jgi:hypothetical protein
MQTQLSNNTGSFAILQARWLVESYPYMPDFLSLCNVLGAPAPSADGGIAPPDACAVWGTHTCLYSGQLRAPL